MLGEHLDWTVTVVGGIDRRGAVRDLAAPAAASEAGKRRRQPLEVRAAGFDDDLEGDDFVTGGDEADCTAVPHRIPQPVRVLAIVTLHFHAVVHGPDRERFMLGRVLRGQARRSNGQCGDPIPEPRSGHRDHPFPAIPPASCKSTPNSQFPTPIPQNRNNQARFGGWELVVGSWSWLFQQPDPSLLFEQRLDSAADLVANRSDPFERLALRIGERPIVSLHTRDDRTLVTAPHGDQHRNARSEFGCQFRGGRLGQVEPSSPMTAITSGWTRGPGSVPAEIARALTGSASALNQAAAICERPALWTHANRTVVIEPPFLLRRERSLATPGARG